MFSIFGTLHADPESFKKIADPLAARGGDSVLVWEDSSARLGVRGDGRYLDRYRVSNPSETVVAVVEGEIYNAEAIGERIGERLSHATVFNSIPILYEKYGRKFPRYLNGIFTIALWDAGEQTLYLIRDHLGSRSLFYGQNDQKELFFASTIRALLNAGRLPDRISLSGIHSYLCSTAVSPPYTLFEKIFCVRPGAMTIWKNGEFSEYRYWPVHDLKEDRSRHQSDFAQQVRSLIQDAIRIRADYGGAYGSLVSGGVDTSVVTAELSRFASQAQLPVFSIAFEEKVYSDAWLQQIMYDRYQLSPHTAVLGPDEFWEILQKAVAQLDGPVNDSAFVGMYKAFEMARQAGCEAVFEGEAADELFYTGHAHSERKYQPFLRIPYPLRKLFFGRFQTIPQGHGLTGRVLRLLFTLGLSDDERRLLVLPSFYRRPQSILLEDDLPSDPLRVERAYLKETALEDPLNIYYYGLLKAFLPNDLLYKNERMASANHLINRTPFIDYRLVELAYQIPQSFKIRRPTATDDGTKLVYKEAVKGLIPNEILERKKQRGFSQPTAIWYRHQLSEQVHDTLLGPSALNREYLNRRYVEQIYRDHVNGVANYDYLLNALVVLELWLRFFKSV